MVLFGELDLVGVTAMVPLSQGVVTGHGAAGPSGLVTGTGVVGSSGIVNGHGALGPTGPNAYGIAAIAAPAILAPPAVGYGLEHGAWSLGIGHYAWH